MIEQQTACFICEHRETESGFTTVTLTRDNLAFITRNVPAQVFEICGEAYADARTTTTVLQAADAAPHAGVHVEVRDYVAA